MGKSLLKIGSSKWTGYEPFYLAEEIGIFKQNNTRIKLFYNRQIDEEIQDLKAGKLDGVTITLDMAISLNNSGFPIKAVLVIDYSIGGDMILARDYIKDINDLKGKKIGMEKLYVHDYFLARSLAENKINKNEIELIYLKNNELKNALSNKKVDAVVAYNPIATELIQKDIHILFSSKNIPGSIIDLLVFPNKIFEENKENIKSLVQSWFDALKYIGKNYSRSMKIMAENENVSEYEYKLAFDEIAIPDLEENLSFFDLESKENIFKISDITKDFITKRVKINRNYKISDMFDSGIIESII